MKLIFPLLISFVFSFDIVFAQNYNVVNPNRTALFANSDSSVFHSVKIDSVRVINGDTICYNFRLLHNLTQPTYDTICYGWGSQGCVADFNQPNWLGYALTKKLNGSINFVTINNDTLFFTFSTLLNDTSQFYEDSIQKFYTINKGTDTLSFFGFMDSIKIFEILHKDTLGNEINSNLNHKKIKIGKELGLINFFNVDSFPANSSMFYLKGITNQDLGLFRVSSADLKPYNPGDEIEYATSSNGAPPKYLMDSILTRYENSDTVYFTSQHTAFCMNCQQPGLYFVQYIRTIKAPKHNNYLQIPFENFIDGQFMTGKLKKTGGCYNGLQFDYKYDACLGLCEEGNCFVSSDCALSYNHGTSYKTGVGLLGDSYSSAAYPPISGGSYTYLYYSNIAGKVCGTKNMVYPGPNAIREINNNTFNLFPNPSSTNINITSVKQIQTITITNSLGKIVWSNEKVFDTEINIDVSFLSASIYFVEVVELDGNKGRKKFIKE